MTGLPVPEGAIFHAKTQRRRVVKIDAGLRTLTAETAKRFRELLRSRRVPPAELKPRCDGCSLRPACNPEVLLGDQHLAQLLRARFAKE